METPTFEDHLSPRLRGLKAPGGERLLSLPCSPWQNGQLERLIGSIRRECLDHVVVFGEAHLRRVLKTYASYYNKSGHTSHWIKMHRISVALYRWATSWQFPSLAGCIINMPALGFD